MADKSSDVDTYIIGAGAYYGLSWIFAFYPAFIFALCIDHSIASDGGKAAFFGLIAMIIGWITINVLVVFRQYLIVTLIYIITFWPFIKVIISCVNEDINADGFQFPIDFWPFW